MTADSQELLTVEEVARLERLSVRRVQALIAEGRYRVKETTSNGGRNGNTQYLIDPASLSPAARLRHLQKNSPEIIDNGTLESIDAETADRLLLFRDAIVHLNAAGGDRSREIVQEICSQFEISRSAFYRLRKTFNETGSLASFIRKKRSDLKRSRSFSQEALQVGLAEYLHSRNKLKAYSMLKTEALINGWQYGSYRAFCRQMNELADKDRAIMAYAGNGRKGLQEQVVPSILRTTGDLEPGDYYCGDHHQFDLFIYDEIQRRVYRPWLTAWQDMATRAIVGWVICPQPNSRTIAQALQHALEDGGKERHFGIPKNAYIDNGKDYRSRYISGGRWRTNRFAAPEIDTMSKAILVELGVEATFALPFNARSKPIERWFKTLEHQFIEHLPGFCGHTQAERPVHELMRQIRHRQLLTLKEFRAMFQEYLDEHHDTPHRGRGMNGRSPNEVWDAHEQTGWGPTIIGDKLILAHLFMMSATRQVQRHGIQLHNEFYHDDALLWYIDQRVEVRWDPDDMSRVYVFQDKQFLCIAEGFNYASMKTSRDELGERIRKQRHLLKSVERRYSTLTNGQRKADNTGSPGTWDKELREKYGDAADEQARQQSNRRTRRKQATAVQLLTEPPPSYFDEDFAATEDLILIPTEITNREKDNNGDT